MAIINDGRLEYEVGSIDVKYPNKDTESYFGSTPLIVPNNWTPAAPPPPALAKKGDLITMDGKEYRVLKMNSNSNATVMSMQFEETPFNKTNALKSGIYEGSVVDNYCETTFYNSLSSAIRNAIIPTNIAQDRYSRYDEDEAESISSYIGTYLNRGYPSAYRLYLMDPHYGNTILRNCYVISVSEIIEYFETTPQMTFETTTLTYENLYNMLLNNATGFEYGKSVYFRTCYPYANSCEIYGTGFFSNGEITAYDVIDPDYVQPAFQIDLSKVEFTLK